MDSYMLSIVHDFSDITPLSGLPFIVPDGILYCGIVTSVGDFLLRNSSHLGMVHNYEFYGLDDNIVEIASYIKCSLLCDSCFWITSNKRTCEWVGVGWRHCNDLLRDKNLSGSSFLMNSASAWINFEYGDKKLLVVCKEISKELNSVFITGDMDLCIHLIYQFRNELEKWLTNHIRRIV